MNVGEN